MRETYYIGLWKLDPSWDWVETDHIYSTEQKAREAAVSEANNNPLALYAVEKYHITEGIVYDK